MAKIWKIKHYNARSSPQYLLYQYVREIQQKQRVKRVLGGLHIITDPAHEKDSSNKVGYFPK